MLDLTTPCQTTYNHELTDDASPNQTNKPNLLDHIYALIDAGYTASSKELSEACDLFAPQFCRVLGTALSGLPSLPAENHP